MATSLPGARARLAFGSRRAPGCRCAPWRARCGRRLPGGGPLVHLRAALLAALAGGARIEAAVASSEGVGLLIGHRLRGGREGRLARLSKIARLRHLLGRALRGGLARLRKIARLWHLLGRALLRRRLAHLWNIARLLRHAGNNGGGLLPAAELVEPLIGHDVAIDDLVGNAARRRAGGHGRAPGVVLEIGVAVNALVARQIFKVHLAPGDVAVDGDVREPAIDIDRIDADLRTGCVQSSPAPATRCSRRDGRPSRNRDSARRRWRRGSRRITR